MKLYKIHIVFEVHAVTKWEAIEKIWNSIADGTFKRYFAYHFTEKDKKILGWWGNIKNQLLGSE